MSSWIIAALIVVVGAVGLTVSQHASLKPKIILPSGFDVRTFHYYCQGSAESLPCLQQRYQTATLNQGVPRAFAILKAAYTVDAAVRADCHQLAHVIGRAAADIAKTVDQAYAQGDNFCWSGYYHGVMESIVTRAGATKLAVLLPTICASIKAQKPYTFYHYNCVHGLGHGIMDVTASNLFASLKRIELAGPVR